MPHARRRTALTASLFGALAITPGALAARDPVTVDVTVTEGTSMSVAATRDGRMLAIDLPAS
jgi:hypothetical protein